MNNKLIQEKYIMLISSYLRGFKRDGSLYNFACPICKDSKTNMNKKRGYLFLDKNQQYYLYHCFNCNLNISFERFLEQIDLRLYEDYKKEIAFNIFNNKKMIEEMKVSEPIKQQKLSIGKHCLVSIKKSIKGLEYLKERHVPDFSLDYIFWTDDFNKLVHNTNILNEKYSDRSFPSEGLVFPLFSKSKTFVGFQWRSIDKNIPKAKRFNIVVSDNTDGTYFGIERIDTNKQHYVIEGTIDSLFLPNSVATLNAHLVRAQLPDAIYFNDNEPRNKNVVKEVYHCISKGYKTVMLPDCYEGYDINDLVNHNIDPIEVLNKYTFQGIMAKTKFSKWTKFIV